MRRLWCLFLVIGALGFGAQVGAQDAQADRYKYLGKSITKDEYDGLAMVDQGKTLLHQGKNKELLELATRAIALAPNFHLTQALYGTALSKVGRLDEAREHLLKALSIDDNHPAAWLSLAAVYTSLGSNAEALNCYKTYLKKFPDHPRVAEVRGIVALANKASAPAPSDSGGDYYDRACSQDSFRWAPDQMPVKVYIPSGSGVRGYRDAFGEIVKQAFLSWAAASNGKVSVNFVDSADNCQIKVVWADSASAVTNAGEGGECKYTRNGDAIKAVVITLLTSDLVVDSLPDARMKQRILHLAGNSLGIMGTSSSPHDAMYFSATADDQNSIVTDRDAKTIQRLYEGAAKPSYSVLNKQAIEAMKAGDLSKAVSLLTQAHILYPDVHVLTDNLAVALYNSGLKELNAAHNEKAIDFFNQSLTYRPDDRETKSDLGICYLNLGVGAQNSGDNKSALAFYQKATPWLEQSHKTDLLAKAVSNCVDILKLQGKASEAKLLQTKYSSVLSAK